MQKPQMMRLSLGSPWSPVVKVFIVLNTLVFLSFLLVGDQINPTFGISYRTLLISLLGVDPSAILQNYTIWQLASYLFVHEAFYHYLFNMLGLWWFGSDVERALGSRKFLQYYLFTGMGAGLVSVMMNLPTIGASGSIYGLLLAYGLLFPDRVLYLYFVIPVKAKYCVILFGLIELVALMGTSSNINHYAHLAGIFFGVLWFFYWSKKDVLMSRIRDYQKKQRRKKFRVISTKESAPEEPVQIFDDKPTIH
jgi:membrane associated rhomboid family serine protease